MQTYRYLLLCLALVLCLHSVVAVPHHAVRRQDGDRPDQSQTVPSTTLRSSRPSATIAPSGDQASLRSDHATSTEASSKPSGTLESNIMQVPVTTASTAPESTPTTGEILPTK
jgi:hypothetical protein